MKYSEYNDREKKFRSLTGLSHEHFRKFLPYFEEAHKACFTHHDRLGIRVEHASAAPNS
jgi:hypothetical protein